MPANRSYDVFLLERGTELTLISQSHNLIHHQPTLTLTRHDTLLYISKTVHKYEGALKNNEKKIKEDFKKLLEGVEK